MFKIPIWFRALLCILKMSTVHTMNALQRPTSGATRHAPFSRRVVKVFASGNRGTEAHSANVGHTQRSDRRRENIEQTLDLSEVSHPQLMPSAAARTEAQLTGFNAMRSIDFEEGSHIFPLDAPATWNTFEDLLTA